MKKIVLFGLVAFSLQLAAQNSIALKIKKTGVAVLANSILSAVTQVSDKTTVTVDIKNTSTANTYTYNVKRYDILLSKSSVDTASAFFCFAGACYGSEVVKSANPLVLQPGQSASEIGLAYYELDADLQESTAVGFSYIKYTFINAATPADSVQFSIKYNEQLNPNGLKEISKKLSKIEVFPNPAKGSANLNISASSNIDTRAMLFNSIGELVYSKDITLTEGKNTVSLNLQNISAGIYFIQVKEGDLVSTRKLIVE